MGMGSSNVPSAPNYSSAAQQTAQGNLSNLNQQTQANRPNQYTPYGSLTWSQDGNGNWSATQSLDPSQQGILNNQNALKTGLMNSLGLNSPQGLQDTQDQAQQAIYKQQTSMLDPQYGQMQDQLRTQLQNQGITQGSEAYNRAMDNFARQRDFAYSQARNSAVTQGMDYANQRLQQGVNVLGATGALNPSLINTPQAGYVSGPDYLTANQANWNSLLAAYNAATGNSNSTLNGIFGLGGALAANPQTLTNIWGNLKDAGSAIGSGATNIWNYLTGP